MFRYLMLWLAATSSCLAIAIQPRQADTYPCTDGVFILAARGADNQSMNPLGVSPNYQDLEGLETIANAIIENVGQGSYLRALPYAATQDPLVHLINVGGGVDKAQGIIKDYAARCDNPRIMLLGYSTGAEVMTSTLIGGQLRGNLDDYKQYIVGGAVFADPSFVGNVYPIDAGNATGKGVHARSKKDYAYYNNNYGSKFRNYCQSDDASCDSGGLNDPAIAVHLAAVKVFQQKAMDFLMTLV